MDSKKIIKNALIIIFVPTIITAGYFTYNFIDRRNKNKKLLELIGSIISKSDNQPNQPTGMSDVALKGWEDELKKLSSEAFSAFYDYANITIGKGKNEENNNWNYQNTNPLDYDKKKEKVDKHSDELTKQSKVMEFFLHLADKI